VIDADVLHWQSAAACRDDARFTCDDPTPDLLATLQAVCRTCPVTAQCDAYAVEVEAAWGMWGGVWCTPQTRAAGRRPERAKRVTSATSGYRGRQAPSRLAW